MKLTIYETLRSINDSADIAAELTKYEFDSILIKYLKIAMGVNYRFSADLGTGFPDGVRINRDFPDGISDTSLRSEHRGMYLFDEIETQLPQKKRTQIFAGVLEGLHYTEADLLVAIKDGKFNEIFPNITYSVLSSTFPESFPVREEVAPLEVATPVVTPEQTPAPVHEQTPEQPKKIDKRSREYRQSIGR